MQIRNQTVKNLILILLVLLPAFFPFAHREHYLIPYEVMDETALIVLLLAVYFLIILPYWYTVGYVFSRWVNHFPKSFFLGNLPVFLNVIGEIPYYCVFHMKQGSYPLIEYLIGSHIDKFNIMDFLGGSTEIISILASSVCFLLAFSLGYYIQQKGFKNFILLR